MTRKEMKQRARKSLRKHYLMFVVVCLIAAFLGTEFSGSLKMLTMESGKTYDQDVVPSGMITQKPVLTEVIEDMLTGKTEEGRELSDAIKEQAVRETKSGEGSAVFGRSRGVFAGIVNEIFSGSVLVTLVSAVNSIVGSQKITIMLLVIAGLLLMFLVSFFLKNMYAAVSRRIFLEGRMYEKLSVQRFAFFLRVKKWTKVSCTMFLTSFYHFLWSLTLVGGVIKRYSYFLVPYIAAENPDISPSKAVTLSRRMMKGHKWECFIFELSYIGWEMLGGITFGLSGIFYSNPYKTAAFSEYYAHLRGMAIENQLEGYELLNDRYLFEKPDRETIFQAYGDTVSELLDKKAGEEDPLKGFRGFLAHVFGISVLSSREEKQYEEYQTVQIRYGVIKDIVEGNAYPGRLFSIPEKDKREDMETLRYLRCYPVWSLILMFFVFSFIGWVWEVSLHLVQDGTFVNRGVLQGPWLPIYGSGGVLILILLNKFRKKPLLSFITTVMLCGCVEYYTSWYLEMKHNGQKWWDYSGYFLNLNGRICGEGLLVFGLGGMAIVYLLAPMLDDLLKKISVRILIPVCLVLVVLFSCDQVYSGKHPNVGKGITDYTGAWNIPEIPERVIESGGSGEWL